MSHRVINRPTIAPDHPDVLRLIAARQHDPYSVLGRHAHGEQETIRAFLPGAHAAWVEDQSRPMQRVGETALFEYQGPAGVVPRHYRLLRAGADGAVRGAYDPYAFDCSLDDAELAAFNAGSHRRAQRLLGAIPASPGGIAGTRFAVWAPNAERVSVVGDFNDWDGRVHPMRSLGGSGVWALFIPGLTEGNYKYELRGRESGELWLKADPYARRSELRPATASLLAGESRFVWRDRAWMEARAGRDWRRGPMTIYELHPGSWQRHPDGRHLGYRELAERLCAHVTKLGFTHVELMPICEHPFDDSWGYQTTGYFAPTSRFGSPDDLRYLVDLLHRHDVGVLLDWVPAHFPRDAHGLANFDGTALYEYHDPRKAEHRDWGTLVFNYERNEVRSFLISSALYWLEEFHFDGLRVDAVASMLYLDFSRRAEHWVPNKYGGRENLEAVDFIRELNDAIDAEAPGCVTIAEESTDWPGVTRAGADGGLGFHFKWNMGWMHDTLNYFAEDPVHRRHHHELLTFGPVYAFSEAYVLPFSHDEVVHLKRSLFGKMPGDEWQRFANLRLLLAYQWTFPGKQLLFMGAELAQPGEWNANAALPWERGGEPLPAGISALIADLNRLAREAPALSHDDTDESGFEWLDCDDAERSIVSYLRRGAGQTLAVVLNFTPVPRHDYRLGVPTGGTWREIVNTDSGYYGGSNVGNLGTLRTEAISHMGCEQSIVVTLPPLGALVLGERYENG